MKAHEFERIVAKLRLTTKNSYDRLAWLEIDGQKVVRTRRSHGNKELPSHFVRRQLHLDESQFADLLKCPLKRDQYLEILRKKGVV
jgi:hypothetical protein